MVELKSKAVRFCESNGLQPNLIPNFLLIVDRLKRRKNLSDINILIKAWEQILPETTEAKETLENQKPQMAPSMHGSGGGIEPERELQATMQHRRLNDDNKDTD